jgi:GMP synthase-like glutamine amidotransferase
MKPVAIFRHIPIEGPGYFATFLDSHSVPWQLIKVDSGEAIPPDTDPFSGLAFMGGPMSVNDDLLWISSALSLIRRAVADNVPVLGHCLGGQLMSKALGGTISRSPVKEIGWGEVSVVDDPIAHEWFGEVSTFEAFHWHGEMFSLPKGSTLLLSSPYCKNQAFALGKHLALQCHVEMTEQMIEIWCEKGSEEIAASISPAVQPTEKILTGLAERVAALNNIAGHLYQRWILGLKS